MKEAPIATLPRRSWTWLRLIVAAAILGVLALRVGAEPFLEGLRQVDPLAVLFALVVTAGTTWCCAWRWSLLARQLDVAVPVPTAYRLYYRSQLLNATLPGGVLGDVHRALDHGREAGALARSARSVVWDRAAGLAVLIALAALALPVLPDGVLPGTGRIPVLAVAVVTVALAVVAGLAARGVWPKVLLASALAAAGHAAVFVVAARTAGVTLPLAQVVALGLLVLAAATVPLSLAGWGPREGATAWLFAAAGLGAATGVSVATTYGVMSLAATLPGLLVLGRRRSGHPPATVPVRTEEVARG